MISGFIHNTFCSDFGILLKANILFTVYSFIYWFVFKQLEAFTTKLGKLSIIKLRGIFTQQVCNS